MVVYAYYPSYVGGIGRRIKIWGQLQAKIQNLIGKITKVKKGWGWG
jgi:hypothetical protein